MSMFYFSGPKTLTELDKQFKAEGITLTVTRVSSEIDAHMVGESMYVTIESVSNKYGEEQSSSSDYDRAMEIISGKKENT